MENTLTQRLTRIFGAVVAAFLLLGLMGGARAQTVVSTGGQFYNQGIAASGHNGTTRQRHTFPLGSGGFYLVYANSASSGSPAGPITITASVELNNGFNTFIPVYFGGQRSIVLPVGGVIRSDFISYSVPAGNYLWSRTFINDGGNGHGVNLVGDASQGNIVQDGADDTVPSPADNMVATASSTGFAPICVVGFPVVTGKPAVIGVGDSITAGQGDTGTVLAHGYLPRALSSSLPFVVIAQGGERVGNQVGPYSGIGSYAASWFHRMSMVQYANDAVVMIGTNDLGAATSYIEAAIAIEWSNFSQAGTKVYACTLLPRTTSTDGWATTTNQTLASTAVESSRTAVNDWIRDGAPVNASIVPVAIGTATAGTLRTGMPGHPATGYFDTADAAESGRNTGMWKPNYTADGTHPAPAGAAAVATAIVLSQLAAPPTSGSKRKTQ